MVVAVDERDRHVLVVGEALRAAEAREASADDHDVALVGRGAHGRRVARDDAAAQRGRHVAVTGASRPCGAQRQHSVDEIEALAAVRDQEHRAVAGRREDVAHELGRGARVQMGGRLVEHEDRRAGEQRPRDDEALPLAAGELASLLADERVQPVGEALDPVPDAGRAGARARSRRRRRPGARGGRCRGCSPRTGASPARPPRSRGGHLEAVLAQVATRQRHPSRLGIEEAQQQVRDGGLPGAAGPTSATRSPGSRRRLTPSRAGRRSRG